MAATDKTYRSQKTLDIVFAVSCFLLLASTVWMFVQDYNRHWKTVQRDFRDVETAMSQREMLAQLPDQAVVEELVQDVDKARKNVQLAREAIASQASTLQAQHDILNASYQGTKADYDSLMSYYNIDIEHLGAAQDEASRAALEKSVAEKKERLARLELRMRETQTKLDENRAERASLERSQLIEIDGEKKSLVQTQETLVRAEGELKEVTSSFDRFAKVCAEKSWKMGDAFRALPILDAFQSPTRVQQIWLPNLTIDYAFKQVPRYDRCTTCHLGIEKGNYQPELLTALASSPKDLQGKLRSAREILQKRLSSGESLPFDIDDIPENITTVELTRGQIRQYAAHPRLDLFVDSNSPHSAEKFGCTICHEGQGSATDFTLASHTPNTTPQEHHWQDEYHWHSSHYWDFPMLPSRFAESSCLKCHHEVTDLIRYGSKEEAPKVLEGYRLVQDLGCFGCHEISGTKSGRPVGPDLRLEPSPALAWLPPGEQEKMKADTQNPPGTYRKVGPSLRRLSEKTDEKWIRQWLLSPRDFRQDTRMPHFYNLTNNNPDSLPDDQKAFPAAEIHSIAHYLIKESQASLKGEDAYRKGLEEQLASYHKRLDPGREELVPLVEKDRKTLENITRSLGDLALLSVPARAPAINSARIELQEAQGQLQEHYERLDELQTRLERLEKKADRTEAEETALTEIPGEIDTIRNDLTGPWERLQQATRQLQEASRPTPLSKQLVGHDGEPVTLPEDRGDASERLSNGRRLFTERGCLACHLHDATDKADDTGVKTVMSAADFGPSLSQIAAKIRPEGGKEARQRWLVQWLLNPNIHHPRTKMPVTFLSVAEAADIADWLLSAGPQEYDGADPEKPSEESLRRLARLQLSRTPGITAAEVDTFLPAEGDVTGIPEDRFARLPYDADERALQAPLPDGELESRLLWYVGKKAVSRLGCYGCHDIMGFETAKPIGTPLNDWGRKDAERLAFEDINAFVRESYHFVPERLTREEIEAKIQKLDRSVRINELQTRLTEDQFLPPAEVRELEKLRSMGPLTAEENAEIQKLRELQEKSPWDYEGDKPPYEQFYADALDHHSRVGFLHQKLLAPRSYDHGRLRVWDDRLRMPEFQFARIRRQAGESDEEWRVRKSRAEAEGREAVMTFVLGLVAEQVPPSYVYKPDSDRMAEVKGRQVLDSFNCNGCHQVRSGVFEVKPSAGTLKYLEEAYKISSPTRKSDFFFQGHSAWVGQPSPLPDRLIAHGTQPTVDSESFEEPLLVVRLTEALQFHNNAGLTRDLRAKDKAFFLPEDVLSSTAPYGGTLADLLTPYLMADRPTTVKGADDARNLLPPPLIRQGERVQGAWLYQFLLNPYKIRPQTVLRMPRFNMSSDDAQALVDYFAAVERRNNPAEGASTAYTRVPQGSEEYWKRKNEEYVKRLGEDKIKKRLEELKPTFEVVLQAQAAELKQKVAVAEEALKKTPEDQKTQAQKAIDALKTELKSAEEAISDKDYSSLEKRYREHDAYAIDGYRLLTTHINSVCLSCHTIGKLGTAQAPPLDRVYDRLRPDWTLEWIAHPQRLFGYDTVMPVNFPRDSVQSQDLFDGDTREQIMAIRDVMMSFPRIADMPVARFYKVAPAGGTQ